MNNNVDLIFISQSEVVNYDGYAKLPIERLDLYKDLIYPRMVYFKGGFRSHYDIINYLRMGQFWTQATPQSRQKLFSIWNLPGFVGPHIANYLKEFNINTHVINNFDAEGDILYDVYEKSDPKPIVAISTTFHLNYAEITRLTKLLRARYPDMSIVLGGAFINTEMYKDDPKPLSKAMKRLGIDYAVHSFNSEVDLKDLILAHKRKEPLGTVNNLVYRVRTNGQTTFRTTKKVWNNPLINNLPDYWEQLDMPFLNHTIQIRTASGCPFNCAFCSYPETAGGHFAMPVATAERQIQSILRRPNINKIIFLDDTFNVPLGRFKDLCHMFCKYNFEWFSFLRVQFVDEEVVKLMKDSGCRGVYLGVESANDQVLKNMNKRATRADFERGIALLKKYDITMMVALVVGFPGESEETIKDNIEFIERNGIQFYTLKEFFYIQNTSIHRDREKFGLTGMGSNWQHNTMNSMQAGEYKMQMFREIKSIFIDPDTSLWYLAYLYDQGFTMKEIADFQQDINKIMLSQMDGNFNDDDPLFGQLTQKLQKYGRNVNTLPPRKFCLKETPV